MNKYNEYREKWVNYPKDKIIERVPIHLDLELVRGVCNLDCIMCPIDKTEAMYMPLEVAKRIIDEFSEKGGYAIKLVYLGEPMLYKHLTEVIKYAKDKGIIDVRINTNGMLITSSLALSLVESGPDLLTFSIDSSWNHIYSKIRVGGKLNLVVRGLLNMRMAKNVLKSNTPKIQIQCIPMELNKKEIEDGSYERFFREMCDEIRFSPYCEDYDITEAIGETPDFFCGQIYQRCMIRANGDIVVCCGEPHPAKILGNIRDSTIEKVWNGSDFQAIRMLMDKGKSHLIEFCKTCTAREHYEEWDRQEEEKCGEWDREGM